MNLDERLSRVERQNKWMRHSGALTLAATAFVLLVAQDKEQTPADLEVRSLVLKDDAGRMRASLRMEEGAPFLVLWDEEGKERASLGGLKSSGLSLSDAEGRKRISIAVLHDGSPGLALYDTKRLFRLALNVSDNGSPTVTLRDASGKERASLSVWDDRPMFELSDGNRRVRAVLGVTTVANKDGTGERRDEGSLVLYDAEGNPVWLSPR